MKEHSLKWLFVICVGSLASFAKAAEGYPRASAQAELATFFHQVSGTATIVDSRTIRVDEFNFDGGGPAVYFYLGTTGTHQAFGNGIPIGGLLSGTVFSNDTVTVSLPEGQTLDGYHALSVWCAAVSVDFGSGEFQPHMDAIDHSNGITSLSVSGASGQVYQLQASTNLTDWMDLDLKTNTTGTVDFTDTNSLPGRFYRTVVQ